eukprot:6188359-Pleurochrysis_carterae.AAC.1
MASVAGVQSCTTLLPADTKKLQQVAAIVGYVMHATRSDDAHATSGPVAFGLLTATKALSRRSERCVAVSRGHVRRHGTVVHANGGVDGVGCVKDYVRVASAWRVRGEDS